MDKKWKYNIEDIIIGYFDPMNGCYSEIPLNLFKPNDDLCNISFDLINYFRTNHEILWNKKSRIDILFNSGDTKSKLRHNPQINEISLSNYDNMPPFVKKLLFYHKTQDN